MEIQFPIMQIMNEQGCIIRSEYREQITKELVMEMYRHLIRTRTFDRKCVSLQRQGRIGTYVPYEGQEACQVGSALALRDGDWMFPTYRDHGAMITFGCSLTQTLLYWKGRKGVFRLKEKKSFRRVFRLPPSFRMPQEQLMSKRGKEQKMRLSSILGTEQHLKGIFTRGSILQAFSMCP
ncbi:hypothetical protein PspKH34_14360 [Parageobacillus sp. KH3-4]|nr:hypothetical protein PspKH34_14360 [Parageobacillus sp. KH3-4]